MELDDRVTKQEYTPPACSNDLDFGQRLMDFVSQIPGAIVVQGPTYQSRSSPYPTDEDMKYIDEE